MTLEDEYDRLRREQRKLSRKQEGSNNYEKQRREVAKAKRHIRRKILDYQHKLSTWLVREYDAVFVEDSSKMQRGGGSSHSSNTRRSCTARTSCR